MLNYRPNYTSGLSEGFNIGRIRNEAERNQAYREAMQHAQFVEAQQLSYEDNLRRSMERSNSLFGRI